MSPATSRDVLGHRRVSPVRVINSDGEITVQPALKHRDAQQVVGVKKARRSRHQHQWTEWHKAGIFDSTLRRDCTKCKRIETKAPKPSIAK